MSFLPENYKTPKSESKYLKFKLGTVKFLPLGKAIFGYEAWKDGKPIRKLSVPELKEIGYDETDKSGNPQKPKSFIAFPVWDYEDETVKILEITQNSIMKSIDNYYSDTDWGDPIMKYSLTVEGIGEGIERRYSVRANPPKEIPTLIIEEFAKNPVNIEALFDGSDPFEKVSK